MQPSPETPADPDDDPNVAPEMTDEEAAALRNLPPAPPPEDPAPSAPAPPAAESEPEPEPEHDADGDDAGSFFDDVDVEPSSDLGESLSPEDLARIEEQRKLEQRQDKTAKVEVEKQEDEAGRQRRQNVRVNVQYPVTIRVAGHPGSKARSRDLSATGVGFSTRLPLEVNDTGSVTVHFADWNFTKEFIVRFVKPIVAGRVIGAQYQELTEDERERVVKEVFAVQRAQLQQQRRRSGGS